MPTYRYIGGWYALMITFAEIASIVSTSDIRQIEMMARHILVNGRSHQDMQQLSRHADEFGTLLATTNPADRDYLALVYILADHLHDIQQGACPCSIIGKPMYNSPDRLTGILEIIEEEVNLQKYDDRIKSRCLACHREYESVTTESGFGQNVTWKELPRSNK
jgi:hypothetical protein